MNFETEGQVAGADPSLQKKTGQTQYGWWRSKKELNI